MTTEEKKIAVPDSRVQPARIRNLMSRPQIFAFPTVHVAPDGERIGPTEPNPPRGSKVLYPEWFYMSIPGEVFEVPPEQIARLHEEAKNTDRLEDKSQRPIKPRQGKTAAVYPPKWEWTEDPVYSPKMMAKDADEEAEKSGNAFQG